MKNTKKPEASNTVQQDPVPECCLTCGNYKPKFWRIIGKECAAFGTVKGVKNNRCGAWCKT